MINSTTHLMALRCATMMEHATDILNDRTNPLIGITNVASAKFRIESDIPRSSFPSTTAVLTDQSISPMGTADGERSLATTWQAIHCGLRYSKKLKCKAAHDTHVYCKYIRLRGVDRYPSCPN